jgi:hypothetical protein
MKKIAGILVLFFPVLLALHAQESVIYKLYKHNGTDYVFSVHNNHVEGFISSDTNFQVFTGKKMNEYRVSLFDAFTNQPLDPLPFDLSIADNTMISREYKNYSDSSTFMIGSNTSGPEGSLYLSMLVPADEKQRDLIFNQVASEITEGTNTGDNAFHSLFTYLTENFREQYLTANKELYNQYGDECYACSWEKRYSVSPLYFDKDYLAVNISRYAFTGGAHGMHHNTILNYDLQTGSAITLDSIVRVKDREILRQRISEEIRKNYGLQAGESLRKAGLFEDTVEISNNYCITSRGISFVYNPYEIGPYAMGVIIVFVPENKLNDVLKKPL